MLVYADPTAVTWWRAQGAPRYRRLKAITKTE